MTARWITSPYKIGDKILGNAALSFQNRHDSLNSEMKTQIKNQFEICLTKYFSIVMCQQNKQTIQIIWIVLVYIKIKVHIKKCLYLCKSTAFHMLRQVECRLQ